MNMYVSSQYLLQQQNAGVWLHRCLFPLGKLLHFRSDIQNIYNVPHIMSLLSNMLWILNCIFIESVHTQSYNMNLVHDKSIESMFLII